MPLSDVTISLLIVRRLTDEEVGYIAAEAQELTHRCSRRDYLHSPMNFGDLSSHGLGVVLPSVNERSPLKPNRTRKECNNGFMLGT